MTTARKEIATIQNFTGCFAIVWGLFVANPYSSLFDKNPALFSPMVSLIPYEAFWGLLCVTVGGTALILNWYRQTILSAVILSIMYSFLSVLYLSGDPSQPTGTVYAILAIFNLLCYKWNT